MIWRNINEKVNLICDDVIIMTLLILSFSFKYYFSYHGYAFPFIMSKIAGSITMIKYVLSWTKYIVQLACGLKNLTTVISSQPVNTEPFGEVVSSISLVLVHSTLFLIEYCQFSYLKSGFLWGLASSTK